MSAFQIFTLPSQQALDASARVQAGATLTFYLTGTTTKTNAYSNSTLATPVANPLTADAGGTFAQFFLDPDVTYKIVLKSSAGATLQTWDPANENILSSARIAASLDSLKQTAAEVSAGVTPVNYAYAPGDPRRYGADPTGVADSRAAFAAVDSVGESITVCPGVYLINSNLTLATSVTFLNGAILKPANGVTLTLSAPFTAGVTQIFDLSLGGLVALPPGIDWVWAEWWGAKGDGSKLDNNVPINQAIAALSVSASGNFGGEVHLFRGSFYVSDSINLADEVSLIGEGMFFTAIRANAGTFNAASPQMVLAKNGTSSMFNARVERLRLDAGDLGTITNVIYAPAWQEKCGTDNVYIANYKTNGILVDTGYGGIAQLRLRRTEFAGAADRFAGYDIKIDLGGIFLVGWATVSLEEITCSSALATVTFTGSISAGATSATLAANWAYATGSWNVIFSSGETRLVTLTNGATTATWTGGLSSGATASATAVTPNGNGVYANGRVILNCQDIHVEAQNVAMTLANEACLTGASLKTEGSNTVQTVVSCAASWTGTVNMTGMMRGGATNFIVDNSRGPYALANAPGVSGYPGGAGGGSFSIQTIWPPNPSIPVMGARCTGSASPAISYQNGSFLSVAHPATGQYRFTISISLSTYHVIASADLVTRVVINSATSFDVFTTTAAGVATDCNVIGVEVYHTP